MNCLANHLRVLSVGIVGHVVEVVVLRVHVGQVPQTEAEVIQII